MNYKKGWSKKRKEKLICRRNNSRYKEIRQRLLNLNLLKKLSSFNTRKYGSQEYFSALEHTSLYKISIKQTCLAKRLQGRKYPSPEQIMKCCREISPEAMTNFVNIALQSQFNTLPKNIQQQLKKSGILIIDFHQDCYYGDKNNPYVRKSRVKKSINLFYEYLTADIYCKSGSFTIALFHRAPRESILSLMKRLLDHVEKVLSIKIILFDGEFPTIDILNLLIHKEVKFLGRKSRTERVKYHADAYYKNSDWQTTRKWRPIELRSKSSNSKAVKVEITPQRLHGEMKFLVKSPGWFITPNYAEKLYEKRFNIETGYRDKHKFQIFMCTKILSTRLLIFLMAILLWNCWQSFLIWIRSLKCYSQDLPRDFLVQISDNWLKFYLIKLHYS